MKPALLLALLVSGISAGFAAPIGSYQQGVVVRMHMSDCNLTRRAFLNQFGPAETAAEGTCPEYTLVSDKVVYVIVGKSSNQLVPLSETIDFRLQNNQMLVRMGDAHKKSKFSIREMTLRLEWEYPEAPRKRTAHQTCALNDEN